MKKHLSCINYKQFPSQQSPESFSWLVFCCELLCGSPKVTEVQVIWWHNNMKVRHSQCYLVLKGFMLLKKPCKGLVEVLIYMCLKPHSTDLTVLLFFTEEEDFNHKKLEFCYYLSLLIWNIYLINTVVFIMAKLHIKHVTAPECWENMLEHVSGGKM